MNFEQFRDTIETAERDDGTLFIRFKKDSEFYNDASNLARRIHAGLLPDGTKYNMIAICVDKLNEYDADTWRDADHEIIDGMVDMYAHDLINWLSSHTSRVDYVNRAVVDFGVDGGFDLIKSLQLGQYLELQKVFNALLNEFEDEAVQAMEENA